MYREIGANKFKTTVLISLFMALVIGLGWLLSYVFDRPAILLVATIVAVAQSWISYFYADKIALAMSQARPVTKKEEPEFVRVIENLSIATGLPKPKTYVINDTAINAFATGRDPKHAAVVVTRGALDKLNKTELEGVLAHEMAHVGNRDILLSTIVVTLVGVVTLISDFFLRWSWFGGRSRDNDENRAGGLLTLLAIVLLILSPIIATLIQLAVSRKREYLADATGALTTRYPEGLASALEKISRDKEILEVANRATAHMYIANPLRNLGGFLNNLFSTHPPLPERIKRLRNMESDPS